MITEVVLVDSFVNKSVYYNSLRTLHKLQYIMKSDDNRYWPIICNLCYIMQLMLFK